MDTADPTPRTGTPVSTGQQVQVEADLAEADLAELDLAGVALAGAQEAIFLADGEPGEARPGPKATWTWS